MRIVNERMDLLINSFMRQKIPKVIKGLLVVALHRDDILIHRGTNDKDWEATLLSCPPQTRNAAWVTRS